MNSRLPEFNSSIPEFNSNIPEFNFSFSEFNSGVPNPNFRMLDLNFGIPELNSGMLELNFESPNPVVRVPQRRLNFHYPALTLRSCNRPFRNCTTAGSFPTLKRRAILNLSLRDATRRLGAPALRCSRRMTNNLFQALADAARANEPVALGIITGAKGSSPQKIGAKALFYPDRKIQGTLGGGCLEAEAQRLALQSLRDGKAQTFELVLDHDFGWDDGLICGGKVLGVIIPNAQAAGETFWNELAKRDTTKSWGVKNDFSLARVEGGAGSPLPADGGASVPASQLVSSLAPPKHDGAHGVTRPTSDWLYTETITPPCALWISGSGHIAQAVAPLALQLDFAVSIFDDRPELANHDFFPREVSLHVGHWEEILTTPFAATPTFGLIVTRGHKHDALVLETWIHRPFQFLGMIGSSRKARIITEHFVKQQIASAAEVARVACPVGLKIKSRSVMEIAVAILAQYIEKRAEGNSTNIQAPSSRE